MSLSDGSCRLHLTGSEPAAWGRLQSWRWTQDHNEREGERERERERGRMQGLEQWSGGVTEVCDRRMGV